MLCSYHVGVDAALSMLDSSFECSDTETRDECVPVVPIDEAGPSGLCSTPAETPALEGESKEPTDDESETGGSDEWDPSCAGEETGRSGGEPGMHHDESNSEQGSDHSTDEQGGGGASHTSDGPDDESGIDECNETLKSRKRVRRPPTWKKNRRIRLRNSGKEYTSTAGGRVRIFWYTMLAHSLALCILLSTHSMTPPETVHFVALRRCPLLSAESCLREFGQQGTLTYRMHICVGVSSFFRLVGVTHPVVVSHADNTLDTTM